MKIKSYRSGTALLYVFKNPHKFFDLSLTGHNTNRIKSFDLKLIPSVTLMVRTDGYKYYTLWFEWLLWGIQIGYADETELRSTENS